MGTDAKAENLCAQENLKPFLFLSKPKKIPDYISVFVSAYDGSLTKKKKKNIFCNYDFCLFFRRIIATAVTAIATAIMIAPA